MMSEVLNYKGYFTRVEFSFEDNILFGKIEGINDLVTFETTDATKVVDEFHSAVDDYLDYCEQIGKDPDKTYSGTFNIRISPTNHKLLALESIKQGVSLNKIVEEAISAYLNNDIEDKVNELWTNYNNDPYRYMGSIASSNTSIPFPGRSSYVSIK